MMQRANFWWNLMVGIGSATVGLAFLVQVFLDTNNSPLGLPVGIFTLWLGYNQIQEATQSLEINDSALIYQAAWKIVALPWAEIGAYVLNDERFVAFDQHGKIVLDIGLRGNDYCGWPVQECLRIRNFIQQKMNEVGAARKSSLSLHKIDGFQFKN